MRRGQLSLSVVEAAVGILLVAAVAAGFTVGVTDVSQAPELDALAEDTTARLGSEPTTTGHDARLVALARSPGSFERIRDRTRLRVRQLLPDDVAFRLRTPHGAVGYPRPPDAVVGSATAPTRHGPVTVWVWYG
jgi:hypothetical protein